METQTKYVKIPKEEYESMKESIKILSDKKLMKRIDRSLKEIREGKFVTLEGLKNEIYNRSTRKH